MAFAFVFPGQGSQSVGMLAALAAEHPAVRATFARGLRGARLRSVASSSRRGPRSALNTTERTQPAMLAAGVATFRLWRAPGGAAPRVVSGHSLGEFTALVCADALEFAGAVRAGALSRPGHAGGGAGGQRGDGGDPGSRGRRPCEAACREAAQGEVVERGQLQLPRPGRDRRRGRCGRSAPSSSPRPRGAKRAVLLPVSVPVAHEPHARRRGSACASASPRPRSARRRSAT